MLLSIHSLEAKIDASSSMNGYVLQPSFRHLVCRFYGSGPQKSSIACACDEIHRAIGGIPMLSLEGR